MSTIDEIETLKKKIEELQEQLSCYEVVAYAQTNDRGDLFNLNLQCNPFIDQDKIVSLYRKK